MKKIIFSNPLLYAFLVILSGCALFAFQNNSTSPPPQQQRFPTTLDDIIGYVDKDGIEHFFKTDVVRRLDGFNARDFYKNYGYLFDFGKHNTLVYKDSVVTINEKFGDIYKTYVFSMRHKEFPFHPATRIGGLSLVEKNGKLTSMAFSKKLDIDVDTTVNFGKDSLYALAKKYVSAKEYYWDYCIQAKKDKHPMFKYPCFPDPKIEIIKHNGEFKLAYKVTVGIWKPKHDVFAVFISPKTGELLIKRSSMNHCSGGYDSNSCSDGNEVNENVSIIYYDGQNVVNPIPNSSYSVDNPLVASSQSVQYKKCGSERRLKPPMWVISLR